MAANDRQEGGDHYKKHGATGEQHWDRVHRLKLDYFQAAITKYVERWKDKGGVLDLKKARHYLDKYIELMEQDQRESQRVPGAGAVEGSGPGGDLETDIWGGSQGDPPK